MTEAPSQLNQDAPLRLTNVLLSSAPRLLVLTRTFKGWGLTFPRLALRYRALFCVLIPKDLMSWSPQQWLPRLSVSLSTAGVVCGTGKAGKSWEDQDTFVLGKLTLQARLSVSWFLTVHAIKCFSVPGGGCSTHHKLRFCLAEETQFRAVTPFYNSLTDISILPG